MIGPCNSSNRRSRGGKQLRNHDIANSLNRLMASGHQGVVDAPNFYLPLPRPSVESIHKLPFRSTSMYEH